MKFIIVWIFVLLALSCVVSAVPFHEILKAFDEVNSIGDFSKFHKLFGPHLISGLQKYEVVSLFVPDNMAFDQSTLGYLHKLAPIEVGLVAKFHGMPSFEDFHQNCVENKPTMAVTLLGSFNVNIKNHHNATILYTKQRFKERSAAVTRILAEQPHLRIYEIDNVLIPSELLGKIPTLPRLTPWPPTPSPAPQAPAPAHRAPAPAPHAPAPPQHRAPAPAPHAPAPPQHRAPAPAPHAPAPAHQAPAPAPQAPAQAPSPVPLRIRPPRVVPQPPQAPAPAPEVSDPEVEPSDSSTSGTSPTTWGLLAVSGAAILLLL